MALTFLEVNTPSCSAEDFDGEIVAINLDTGRYFSIKDSAGVIWQDLAAGHAVETILAAIGDDAGLAEATREYISELQAEGLLRLAAEPVAATTPIQMTLDMALPLLDAFGDMESLLLLDPVHEVDESVGWPKPRES